MTARTCFVALSWVALVAGGCSSTGPSGDSADGEGCASRLDCASNVCARGFCSGRPCCEGGTGACASCEAGWTCVACNTSKEGLFCSDRCRKSCSADTDCPATWACTGSTCAPRPNPTRFVFPDGGFVIQRNATAVLAVEVLDAEDGFLDGGFYFRDDSRTAAPVVELPGHSVTYDFGPLDFQGAAIFRGFSRFGDPLDTTIPFRVCREAQEACGATTPPCCGALSCSGTCQ